VRPAKTFGLSSAFIEKSAREAGLYGQATRSFFREASDVFANQGWLRLYILEHEEKGSRANALLDYREALYLLQFRLRPPAVRPESGHRPDRYCSRMPLLGARGGSISCGAMRITSIAWRKDSPIFRMVVKRAMKGETACRIGMISFHTSPLSPLGKGKAGV